MALLDFYTINSFVFEDNALSASVKINPNHSIFSGHFPDNPITPGVVQIQIVKELLEKHYGEKLKMKEMGRCKFVAILNPNECEKLDFNIEVLSNEMPLKIKVVGKDDNTIYLKFNASYER